MKSKKLKIYLMVWSVIAIVFLIGYPQIEAWAANVFTITLDAGDVLFNSAVPVEGTLYAPSDSFAITVSPEISKIEITTSSALEYSGNASTSLATPDEPNGTPLSLVLPATANIKYFLNSAYYSEPTIRITLTAYANSYAILPASGFPDSDFAYATLPNNDSSGNACSWKDSTGTIYPAGTSVQSATGSPATVTAVAPTVN